METGIIYYTDNRIDPFILNQCQEQIKSSFGGEIVSASLKPIDFGINVVVEGKRGYPTMIKQILTALEKSTARYVFFCEHDVLYHKSHFDFVPPRDDVYYYNSNNWRWRYPTEIAITYDSLISLSGLCCNKELAIKHFELRLKLIGEAKEYLFKGEPGKFRTWGYEPGTKSIKRGGITNEVSKTWSSKYPNIDIRHDKTFSPPKTMLSEFKHPPNIDSWKEESVFNLPGWEFELL